MTTDTHAELHTQLGAVTINPVGDRAVYVRAGQGEGDHAPLELGRGATVRIRAHYQLRAGAWIAPQPFLNRADRPDLPPSRTQTKTVLDAIGRAITEWAASPEGARALTMSQAARMMDEADSRAAIAAKLQRIAQQLDREAHELRAGGRVEHLRGDLSSGMTVRTTQVRTAAGALLPPLEKPPTVYGATRYPGSIRNQQPDN